MRQTGSRAEVRWPTSNSQASVDAHVSEGTNTKDQKAEYLAAMFKRMGELLGPLHHESYLHVDEVRGDAYGFGGLTQERRYIAGQLEVAPQRTAA
jgi:4-oxalocrotonate tautomerase